MKKILSHIKKYFITEQGTLDWYLFTTVFILSLLGVIYSYSSQLQIYGGTINFYNKYIKQSIYFFVGIIMLFLIRQINYRKVLDYYWLLYGFCILSLFYTLISGVVVNGSKRWISLGLVNIQPSEFVKIILILFVAAFIEKKGKHVFELKNLLFIFVLLALPTFLIFIQPDLGTAALFVPTIFVIFWLNGLPLKYTFFILITTFISILIPLISTYYRKIDNESAFLKVILSKEYMFYLILFFIYFSISLRVVNMKLRNLLLNRIFFFTFSMFIGLVMAFIIDNFVLKDYQRQRLIVFLNPFDYQWDFGYNVVQSQITIGSGGFWGKGLFNGNYSQLGFLPSRTTDFIFSVIAEELGFVGASLVLFLLFLLLFRIWRLVNQITDNVGKNIILGIFCIFSLQIIINIGMTLSLLPVTGIPLPFVSAGGSTLISSLLGIGIILSIQSRRWVNNAY